jgi:hypothetical protein
MGYIKKTIIKVSLDIIPAIFFVLGTVFQNEDQSCSIMTILLYLLGFISLDLHTYFINQLNNKK